MAGTITMLRAQKRNLNRVNVYLDGRYALALPDIVAATLKVGQFLSDAEIDALEEQGSSEKAYNATLNYLSYRPRSRAEVVAYLKKRDLSETLIETVTQRLERAGLVDDEEFVRFWVGNRERFRPRGPMALRYELRTKGIGDELIDQALASLDVSDSAYRAAGKKARQLATQDHETFTRKLVEYLARRGFQYGVARDIAERHWIELTMDGDLI
jgi:regulatory protein